MKHGSRVRLPSKCPYDDCRGRRAGPAHGRIVRKGEYWRGEDSRWITRFFCLECDRSFSASRLTPTFKQKKRRINGVVRELLCSGVSQRRIAKLLKINRKTVVRKLLFLAEDARFKRREMLDTLAEKKPRELQFDEMESFEWSKCLPVSIPIAVLPESRKILGFRVGRMPAKGPLAEISRKKYGMREDDRAEMASALFAEIRPIVSEHCLITTDQNPRYPTWLKPDFPKAEHHTVKGRRGCVVGQGELKKIGFDPLFSLNHTCAMIRANVNRLFRRTWCTTKRRDRLEAHLEIYAHYHNTVLT
jgi:transposase-like protein